MVNAQDRRIFNELIRSCDRGLISVEPPDQLVIGIGKFFLGTPYFAGSLETNSIEKLIINLRGYDCVTFIENVVAMALLVRSRQKSFDSFRKLLQTIRYRRGMLRGYTSRLHYFSDWIRDNQKKGILKDITAEIGGRPFRKTLHFMTAHRDLYPPLKVTVNFRRMKSLEKEISKRSLYFIPKKAVRYCESQFRDGDLIAIVTNKEGLDIEHVGIAARVKSRIHLLHATSIMGQVTLSERTLYRHLMQSKTRAGIMAGRILCSGNL